MARILILVLVTDGATACAADRSSRIKRGDSSHDDADASAPGGIDDKTSCDILNRDCRLPFSGSAALTLTVAPI